ncbi:MAG: hypothetical protein H7Z40_17995 [Phycisphaerae bacterium]|nr:hypothetical protein [Gemmatimonadaceae bacterium]
MRTAPTNMLNHESQQARGARALTLEARLLYLRNWELANVLLVPALIAVIWLAGGDPARVWHRRAIGAIAVSWVLLQGGVYWHIKLAALRKRTSEFPSWFAGLFTTFRWINLPLFAAGGVWMFRSSADRGSGISADLPWALALLTLAVLEHINYFHRQLMHDTVNDMAYLRRYRRLRRAPLAHDLRRAIAAQK